MAKTDPGDKIKVSSTSGVKKSDTYQLMAHDGVRFIKVLLLMPNQSQIIKKLHTRNKYFLKSGYVDTSSERGTIIIQVDGHD